MRLFSKNNIVVNQRKKKFAAFCLALFLAFLPSMSVLAQDYVVEFGDSSTYIYVGQMFYANDTLSVTATGCGMIYVTLYDNNGDDLNTHLFADNMGYGTLTIPTSDIDNFIYWEVTSTSQPYPNDCYFECDFTAVCGYTVTFNANGHGTAPSTQTIRTGGTVTEPDDLSATGYTFGGWYTDSACTDSWDFSSDTVSSDLTLYAKWTANTYTVSFNANGHGSAPSSQTVNYGNKATKPSNPTASGYTFGGWYT
ncbi:MAG: InlB B-repeat-containing protein, partial [Lachnospiraceae bacterium]|nr:InlB B-repeat-containing protein [Lachnospiraceae bacterium]